MGIKTVIFDCIIFMSYLASIYFSLKQMKKIVKGLETLEKDSEGLNELRTVKLHHKRYTNKFIYFIFITVGFLLVGIIAAALDGISNLSEEMLSIVMPILLVTFLFTLVAFSVYNRNLKRKYNIKIIYSGEILILLRNTGGALAAMNAFSSLAFAAHTSLIVYTIGLWIL